MRFGELVPYFIKITKKMKASSFAIIFHFGCSNFQLDFQISFDVNVIKLGVGYIMLINEIHRRMIK